MAARDAPDDETIDPRRARKEALPAFTLRKVYDGASARVVSELIDLREGSMSVGRHAHGDNPVVLQGDRRASRLHAVLHVGAGCRALRVVNQSQHGTQVNGADVGERDLADSDVLRIGDCLFVARRRPQVADGPPTPRLVGDSPELRSLRTAIARVGPSTATALILGETGTGKEATARALHECSGRAGPFMPVNCGAIPEALAESELFGHVAGAFTGAQRDDVGMVRSADGGTLFLDEIGELSPAIQPKLLRVLDDKAVAPVGGRKAFPVDVRVVVATNRDLVAEIEGGRFRADLYARLAEITLHLSPLRERKDDVLALMQAALGPGTPPMSPDLAHALLLHRWPFNVREVFKVATELRVLGADDETLELSLVEQRLAAAVQERPPEEDRKDLVPAPSKEELDALLRAHKGVLTEVARVTGRSRRQVARWCERFGFDPDAYRVE